MLCVLRHVPTAFCWFFVDNVRAIKLYDVKLIRVQYVKNTHFSYLRPSGWRNVELKTWFCNVISQEIHWFNPKLPPRHHKSSPILLSHQRWLSFAALCCLESSLAVSAHDVLRFLPQNLKKDTTVWGSNSGITIICVGADLSWVSPQFIPVKLSSVVSHQTKQPNHYVL